MTTLMHESCFVAKRAIHGRRIFETNPVRDDEGRIDLAAFDAFEQDGHVLVHVRLAHLERQPLRERGAQRKLVQPSAVDAGNRDRAALAAGADGLPKRMRPIGRHEHRRLGAVVPGVERRAVRFEADRVDARVRTLPAGHVAERVEHVDVLVVQRLGAALRGRELEPFGEAIDRDDAFGAEQIGALDRELTDRTAAPDRHRVARLDLAVLGRHVAGREDVGEKQDLLVGEGVRHLQRSDVGKRDARVFRLAAGIAAVHVRVAEQARRGIAVELLRHPRIRIRVVAQRPELLLAEVAAAARDGERHHDAIADLQPRVVLADLDDLAHELVAEHVALLHRRDVAVVDVQIGAADRRRRDLDDGVARIEDDRVRNGLDLDLLCAFPADGSHGRSYAVAVARGISPASSSCLKCRRSSRMV